MGQTLSIETRISEAAKRWGISLKRKNSNEACGACPFCRLADDDGFLVFSNGGYFCRKCGVKGWIDENEKRPKLSNEKLLELRIADLEHKQREHERRLTALEQMARCKDHIHYHNALTELAREYWYNEGIYDEAIEKFTLGYCHACPTYPPSPSYTFPIVNGGKLENIRHRLTKPGGNGKYRPHRAGLGVSLYNADALKEANERVLVVEGEKKTIVASQSGFPAVGICGKRSFNRKWMDGFAHIGAVYVVLDPDATESAQRLAAMFDGKARVVDMPCKIDDAIAKFGASSSDIEMFLSMARPVGKGQ